MVNKLVYSRFYPLSFYPFSFSVVWIPPTVDSDITYTVRIQDRKCCEVLVRVLCHHHCRCPIDDIMIVEGITIEVKKETQVEWMKRVCIFKMTIIVDGITIEVKKGTQVEWIHSRMVDDSGTLTTTTRILIYNRWKENCGKLQMDCSEFHQWLIHFKFQYSTSSQKKQTEKSGSIEMICPYMDLTDVFFNHSRSFPLYSPSLRNQSVV